MEQNHGIQLIRPIATGVVKDGKQVALTRQEGIILEQVLQAHPRPVAGREIYTRLYPQKYGPAENIVRVWITKIRKKVAPLGIHIIHQPHGGYRLIDAALNDKGSE